MNHFDQGGHQYASHRPDYPDILAERLAALAPNRSHALDVGCGTGQFSVQLASHFAQVYATDPSESQIENATQQNNIHYAVGCAETIALPNRSCALITAAQSAHWFKLDRFYAEARRVACEGAVVALVSYGVLSLEGALGECFQQHYWGPLHAYWPAGREHVEGAYRDLPFPFEPLHCDCPDITRDWVLADLVGYIKTWSATKRALAAGEQALVAALIDELTQLWPDPTSRRRIVWPVTARVGRL